jgi:hypothetical protein
VHCPDAGLMSQAGKLKACYDRGMIHRKRLIEASFNVLVAASQAFIAARGHRVVTRRTSTAPSRHAYPGRRRQADPDQLRVIIVARPHRRTKVSVAGKRNFAGRDKGAETAPEDQGDNCRDMTHASDPANSALLAQSREIAISEAYNQSPEAVAFYEFTRTMQSYKSIIAENTTIVLSTNSDLFKFLKGMVPDSDVVPAPRSGDNR